jgi:hypothetical protein
MSEPSFYQKTSSSLSNNFDKLKTFVSSKTSSIKLSNLKLTSSVIVYIVAIFIVLTIIIFSIWYVFNKLSLDSKNCSRMNNLYGSFPSIQSISTGNDQFSHNLRDYYIKTAYNCCSAGTLKNDFVNICALKNCIKQGVRCLDFEIYSVDNSPVISVSSQNSFNVKESYNTVNFSEAMSIINDYAFSGSTCPNPGDPLIIHLRIMSNNKPIYDTIANVLYNTLSRHLLGKKFSYENNGKNIGTTPLKNLMGKVIVIVDKSNPLFGDTLLDEYVNLASNSVFMRAIRFNDVKNTPDMQELIEFNKKKMSIVLPDLSSSSKNPSAILSLNYGCQMVGLSLQSYDPSLEYYNEMFDKAGTAFVLKPKELRHIPVTIPAPPPPDPKLSYKNRVIETVVPLTFDI